jgi:hypothetical protein
VPAEELIEERPRDTREAGTRQIKHLAKPKRRKKESSRTPKIEQLIRKLGTQERSAKAFLDSSNFVRPSIAKLV